MFSLLTLALFGLLGPEGDPGSGGGGAGTGSASPSTSTPSSAPAASTPASAATPVSPTGTGTTPGTTPATPSDDLQDGNWRELRSRYESQKAEIATLKSHSASASQVITHAQSMAKTLGYTEQDFSEAFTANPMRTLEILQAEAAEKNVTSPAQPDPKQTDLTKQLEDMVKAKLDPIQEFHNRQATEVAMTKYEGVLADNIKSDPILSSAPPEVVDIVKDYIGEYFSSQPEVLLAMKQKGDFSAVPDAVKFVAGRLHGAFKAWLAKSGGTPAPASSAVPGRPNGRGPSLDEIINDPGVLGSKYKA